MVNDKGLSYGSISIKILYSFSDTESILGKNKKSREFTYMYNQNKDILVYKHKFYLPFLTYCDIISGKSNLKCLQ